MSSGPNALRGRTGEGPPVAPVGWKWAAGTRVRDMYFFSPTGQKFKSRASLARYLATIENPPPMNAFQWKYSLKDNEGLPLPGISESSKDADTNIADPKKKRIKSEEKEKDADTNIADPKKKRKKSEEKEKEKKKDEDEDVEPKKKRRKLEEKEKEKENTNIAGPEKKSGKLEEEKKQEREKEKKQNTKVAEPKKKKVKLEEEKKEKENKKKEKEKQNTKVAEPKTNRRKLEEGKKEKEKEKKEKEKENTKVAEPKKNNRKLEEGKNEKEKEKKEKEKENTKVVETKKKGIKLEEGKKKKEEEKEKKENENEDDYMIDIEGCKKLDDSASYYVLPSHIKNQQHSAEKNSDLDDSYYLTPNERAIIAQNENPPMRLTETLGPEESCLNDTYFVHEPSGMTCSVVRKRGREQALLDIEEYRFEMNRPLLLIKSAMERVNMLISHVNIKQESGEETKEMEFNVHDLVEPALKRVDPRLCQLLSNGYDGLFKLSSTLEEKAKEYEAKIHDKKKKFEELSAMFMLNGRISSCIKQHNKRDRENPEKFFSNEEISKIKEIYRDDGDKIVADLRKDVFQTCRRISKRFLRDVPKLQKELEITD